MIFRTGGNSSSGDDWGEEKTEKSERAKGEEFIGMEW